MKSYTMTQEESERYNSDDESVCDDILVSLGLVGYSTEHQSVHGIEIYHTDGYVAEVYYAPPLPRHILDRASSYVIMDDGLYRWPASLACVRNYDGDILSDEGIAACPIPQELLPYVGYGPGSEECGDVCDALWEAGAHIWEG
jgi:hypothetical protein